MKKFICREFFKRPVISQLVELADKAKSRTQTPLLQPHQKLVVDLCKNARCAALLFQYLDDWVENHRRTSESSMSTFHDNILLGALSSVVERYISMNALQDFTFPQKVLLLAVAVCECRLPYLPSFESLAMKRIKLCLRIAREKNDVQYPDDLHEALVVGGVLVDHLHEDEDQQENALPETGRYSIYPAHLAMVQIMLGFEENETSSSSSSTRVFDSPLFVEFKNTLKSQIVNSNKTEIIK